MLISVVRTYKEKVTTGIMFVNGSQFCNTIERPKSGDIVCIPEGEYSLHMTFSPRLRYVTPQVMMVPGRTGIRIHPGNFVKDGIGCILVGYDKGIGADGIDCVFNSKICFNELNRWLLKANEEQVLAIEFKSCGNL